MEAQRRLSGSSGVGGGTTATASLTHRKQRVLAGGVQHLPDAPLLGGRGAPTGREWYTSGRSRTSASAAVKYPNLGMSGRAATVFTIAVESAQAMRTRSDLDHWCHPDEIRVDAGTARGLGQQLDPPQRPDHGAAGVQVEAAPGLPQVGTPSTTDRALDRVEAARAPSSSAIGARRVRVAACSCSWVTTPWAQSTATASSRCRSRSTSDIPRRGPHPRPQPDRLSVKDVKASATALGPQQVRRKSAERPQTTNAAQRLQTVKGLVRGASRLIAAAHGCPRLAFTPRVSSVRSPAGPTVVWVALD